MPRTILLTGAANGLGRAMALGALDHGHRVIAVDLDEAGLARLAVEAPTAGALETRSANLSDDASLHALLDGLAGEAVDVLVNNAGVGPGLVRPDFFSNPYSIWDIPPDKWRKGMAINLDAAFHLIRWAVPGMLARGFGRIVNVTTNFDSMLRPNFAPYGCSKAALEALSGALATELSGSGVTVNVLIPGGPADTAMIPDGAGISREAMVAPQAMVAPLLWLASEASAPVTGRRFVADGWAPPSGQDPTPGQPIGWPDLAGTDRSTPMAGG